MLDFHEESYEISAPDDSSGFSAFWRSRRGGKFGGANDKTQRRYAMSLMVDKLADVLRTWVESSEVQLPAQVVNALFSDRHHIPEPLKGIEQFARRSNAADELRAMPFLQTAERRPTATEDDPPDHDKLKLKHKDKKKPGNEAGDDAVLNAFFLRMFGFPTHGPGLGAGGGRPKHAPGSSDDIHL